VLTEGVDEIWRHLDLAYAGFDLGVSDEKAAIAESDVADQQVAELADADAAPAERLDDGAASAVRAAMRSARFARWYVTVDFASRSCAAMSAGLAPDAASRATRSRVAEPLMGTATLGGRSAFACARRRR
jgi:hypothetical protein